jgi:hypothetical protein
VSVPSGGSGAEPPTIAPPQVVREGLGGADSPFQVNAEKGRRMMSGLETIDVRLATCTGWVEEKPCVCFLGKDRPTIVRW